MVDSAYFVKSLLLELSLDIFNTVQICYRYMEDVHEEVLKIFFLSNLQGF